MDTPLLLAIAFVLYLFYRNSVTIAAAATSNSPTTAIPAPVVTNQIIAHLPIRLLPIASTGPSLTPVQTQVTPSPIVAAGSVYSPPTNTELTGIGSNVNLNPVAITGSPGMGSVYDPPTSSEMTPVSSLLQIKPIVRSFGSGPNPPSFQTGPIDDDGFGAASLGFGR
jgi:hypothetical protein